MALVKGLKCGGQGIVPIYFNSYIFRSHKQTHRIGEERRHTNKFRLL